MMRNTQKTQQGFSLIEVLIVVAIVAVIAAIAMPSYNDSTTKTRRGEGKAFLLQVAQMQERHYTEFGRYAAAGTTNAADVDRETMLVTLTDSEFLSDNGYYAIDHSDFGTDTDGTSFDLTAIPQDGQATSDTDCGNLSLDNLGRRDSNDNDLCW